MIGQVKLKNQLSRFLEENTFPRFSIFVGPGGSGKKILAKWIVSCMQSITSTYGFLLPDVKVDTIRTITQDAYKIAGARNVYIIPDADDMSLAAKNALLKVTEEPPNDCYFIMTLEDENNTLETIRSRGTVFHMDRYTPDEIYRYAKENVNSTLHNDEWSIIKDICDTPGDVNILGKYPREFYDYVELVVDNISEVSLANSFKIPSKVALKEDAEGYDLKLFWKAFIKVVFDRSRNEDCESLDILQYSNWARITSKYLQKLDVRGINKQMLIDNWVMEVRDLWN